MNNDQPSGTFEDIDSYGNSFKPLLEAEERETCHQNNANVKWSKSERTGKWSASYKPERISQISNCRKGDKFSLEFVMNDNNIQHAKLSGSVDRDYQQLDISSLDGPPNLDLTIEKVPDSLLQLIDHDVNHDDQSGNYTITVTNDKMVNLIKKKFSSIDRLTKVMNSHTLWEYEMGQPVIHNDQKNLINLLLGGVNFRVHNQLSTFDEAHDMTDRGNVASDLNASEIAELRELNESQKKALEEALSQRITLIDGPPGTGKTKTAAAIIFKLYGLLRADSANAGTKILVCAQSNVAVDNIAERLDRVGLNIVRLRSQEQCELDPDLKWALDVKMKKHPGGTFERLREMEKNIDEQTKANEQPTSERLRDELGRIRCECEKLILNEADVICCTLISAARLWRKNIHFDTLLIDECCQATEPECLVPITLWPRRLILIGDERQLGPVVHGICESTHTMTLFTRLKERSSNAIQSRLLNRQYRMHPSISNFPTKQFYDGLVTDGIQRSDRVWNFDSRNSPFLRPNEPLVFYDCTGPEEQYNKSYRNRGEANIITTLLAKLRIAKVLPHQIGIICPYRAQQGYLEHGMKNKDPDKEHNIQVGTVDGFQGKEKDFIIISCVRSNRQGHIGFLKDRRRLNVALTRAKFGLMIVGNANTLSSESLVWAELITHIKSRGLMRQATPRSPFSTYGIDMNSLRITS